MVEATEDLRLLVKFDLTESKSFSKEKKRFNVTKNTIFYREISFQ